MIVGAVAPLIQGDVPPPLIEVMSADEVKTALITLVVALIGTITALMLYLKAKFDKQQRDLAAVKDQTVNTHGPDGKNDNLREQIDRLEDIALETHEEMVELRKEQRSTARRMDHQFGEAHDRDIQTNRRIENLEVRAEEDHRQLRTEIARKQDV